MEPPSTTTATPAMAETSESPIVPTAVDLHVPKFPYSHGNSSNSTQGTDFRPERKDGGTPRDTTSGQGMVGTPEATGTHSNETSDLQRPTAQISRIQSAVEAHARPQTLQKSATERPRIQPRTSLFGKKRAESSGKRAQLLRQPTLTFDPYSSESSSSSDEEDEPQPPQPSAADGAAHEQPRTKRTQKSDRGPFSRFKIAHDDFNTKGRVSKRDGRLKLSINETVNSGYFAKTLGAGLKKHFKALQADEDVPVNAETANVEKTAPEEDLMEDPDTRVRLNIVVIVIGSRGDIQPFLKIGKILKEDYGHRVRIATHPAFKKFVEQDSGLEFFSVGGDPSELMAFMVKNPGLIPSVDTIKEGEIGKRRAAMFEMFQGMWRACINSTDDEDDHANLKMMGTKTPFVADAIIANPPSFAPPHIAERLGIPLHMMFTFPYTPTVQFPHPLANIKASNVDANYVNFMSYPLVEMMTWQGLGDLINRFRAKTLWLDEVSTLWAPGQLYRLKVPYTYMWSPGLVPKPNDWGPEIDISGFVFLDLASSFTPPDELSEFLDAGEPPVYIGFGSIVVDDPDKFTSLIFEAVKQAGVRALVSKGWGGFGSNADCPDNIFMLENTPHDWLFPRVSAVVHHGGAGTTAIGLKCGKPTMIVPFFGDQPFWGNMVARAKAGAHDCIPYKDLTAERLAEGIKQCLTDEARENVRKIAESIEKEGDGALNAVRSFHRSLPLNGPHSMRCDVLPNRCASWKLKNTTLKLSPLAAYALVHCKKIRFNELRLLRHYEWNDFGGPGEPLTGLWGAMMGTMGDVFMGVGLVPVKMARSVKKREKYYEKRYKVKKRDKQRKEKLAKANADLDSEGPGPNVAPKPKPNARPAPPQRNETTLSTLEEPEDWLAEELAHEAGHGFKKTGTAILKSPMYFSVALAQGFHNAPRLYGDETVRRPPRITGFHSGLRAGRDEFVHGVHDGVTGIWQHPVRGAKEGGVLGCLRGVGMGVGGLLLKDIAAMVGPWAYLLKGLSEEEAKKHQPTAYLRRARISQGFEEWMEQEHAEVSLETQVRVEQTWSQIQPRLVEEKRTGRSGIKAALLGHREGKEGVSVPRKKGRKSIDSAPKTSSEDPTSQLNKAKSAPLRGGGALDLKEEESGTEMNGHAAGPADAGTSANTNAKLDGQVDGAVGISKSKTAPDTSMSWKEKGAKKKMFRFEPRGGAERKMAVRDAVNVENGVNGHTRLGARTDSDTVDWAKIREREGLDANQYGVAKQ